MTTPLSPASRPPVGSLTRVARTIFSKLYGGGGVASLLAVASSLPLPASELVIDPPKIVERGPHHRVIETQTSVTDADGFERVVVGSYVELATGMHAQDPATGEWVETQATFALAPTGAVADKTAHKVRLAGNLNTEGAVHIVLPDGRRLRGHVLGLSLFDRATGKSVTVAEVKDSNGLLLAPAQDTVLYADCFTGGVSADVVYRLSRAGLEQDVFIKAKLPFVPEDYGLATATTQLQVVTEWIEAPEPVIESRQIKAEAGALAEAGIVDDYIDFGSMQIGSGQAFLTAGGNGATEPLLPVAKRWQKTADGRVVLFESVEFELVEQALAALPDKPQAAKGAAAEGRRLVALKPELPAAPAKGDTERSMTLARVTLPQPALVLDYVILSSATNFTFKGDTTYYVNGSVQLTASGGGSTTLEGGAVVKFDAPTSAYVQITGSISCQTAPYRPFVCTAKDDDSIGEKISGSTGSPSGHYGEGLRVVSGATLNDLRFCYAHVGIKLDANQTLTLADSQFVKCKRAFYASGSNTFKVENCLFNDISLGVVESGTLTFTGVNLTVHQANRLGNGVAAPSTLNLTNTLLVAITNQVAEGTSRLDIGYHYYALNPNVTVTLSATDPDASEPTPSDSGVFTVTRSGSTAAALTVQYTLSGMAVNGTDYSSLSGTVTIPSGSATAPITVSPLDDSELEFHETVIASLVLTTNYTLGTPDSGVVTIKDLDDPPLTNYVATLTQPVGIDYHSSSNSLIVSLGTATGSKFMRIASNGATSNWSSASSISGEVKLATVKTTVNGFTNGWMYFGTAVTGKIGRVSADASIVTNPWATLTNATYSEPYLLRGSLYVDQTGVFGNELVAVTGDDGGAGGGVWRVPSSGAPPVLLATLGTHLEGVITLPNDELKYGPWAGKILMGAEDLAKVIALDPNGVPIQYSFQTGPVEFLLAEDFDLVATNAHFYVTEFSLGKVIKIPKQTFSGFDGDVLITQEGAGGGSYAALHVVRWDGCGFLIRRIIHSGHFEHTTFAEADIPVLP